MDDCDIPGTPPDTEEDIRFYRWYGPWTPLTPPQVVGLMSGFDRPWWIVGGWAIEGYTGVSREHEDIDMAIFRSDLPALLDHLLPRVYKENEVDGYCVWSNLGGTLRPLRSVDELLEGSRQLWVRRDGASPWLMDLLLTPGSDSDEWVSIRDDGIRMPFSSATFVADSGIRYLRPEVALHLKARLDRPKDLADLTAVLETLEPSRREWLRGVVAAGRSDHPWLSRL